MLCQHLTRCTGATGFCAACRLGRLLTSSVCRHEVCRTFLAGMPTWPTLAAVPLPVPPPDVFCLPTQLFGNGLNHSGEVFSTRKNDFLQLHGCNIQTCHFS